LIAGTGGAILKKGKISNNNIPNTFAYRSCCRLLRWWYV